MRAFGFALLFGFAVTGEAFSDFFLRVHGNNGKNGLDASAWDRYMSIAMLVALFGIVYDLYLHSKQVKADWRSR